VLAVVTLSLALAMDATAVAAARGLAAGAVVRREAVLLPALFGGFQAGMAAVGWLAGRWFGAAMERWDHWIAFGLLLLVGGKMIVEAVRGDDDEGAPDGDLWTLLGLALATSIDAAAAGITLPLLAAPPALALATIGVITAALTLVGVAVGARAGRHFGSRLEIVGGLVLVGLAIKILIEGLA